MNQHVEGRWTGRVVTVADSQTKSGTSLRSHRIQYLEVEID